MKAWQITEIGDPAESVNLVELPEPSAGAGEVLVAVKAVALGFPDYLLAVGKYHDKPELPFAIGGEAAGTVQAVGEGVTTVAPGDRVIVLPGDIVGGRLLERLVVPEELVLPLPDDMPDEEGAALFVAYQTAYMGLFRRAGLRAGETLLVHGAAGGVGSAAVELGKAAGARVIAVAGGEEKAEVCRKLGADEVVDHRREDFVARVKELTAGAGADVIFDPVGGEIFDRSRRCVAVEGRLLVVGFAGGTVPQLPVNHALLKNYSVVGFRTRPFRDDPAYRREVHDALLAWYAAGAIRPVVGTVAFSEVHPALARLGNREVIGRLVVRVG